MFSFANGASPYPLHKGDFVYTQILRLYVPLNNK